MARLARALVRLSAWLAPSHFRDRWREEWLAEIDAHDGGSMITRSLGAPLDALSSHWTVPPPPHTYTTPLPTRSDVLLALRQVQQAPLLSVAAVAALAVGMTTATIAFTMILNLFYSELPVPHPDRIAKIHDFDRTEQWGMLLDYREYDRRRDAARSYATSIAAYSERTALVTAPDRGAHQLMRVAHITPNLSAVVETYPVTGRDLTESDMHGAPVALISSQLHERLYDGAANIIGRIVRVDERNYEIVGVMPAGWRFPMTADIWIPLDPRSTDAAAPLSSLHLIGRLRDDATYQSATAEMQTIAAAWRAEPGHGNISQLVMPFTDSTATPAVRYSVWAVVVVLVLLLCISAGNVANIVLARALGRRREMAVRSALGASRARLVLQVSIEALVLSSLAALVSVLAARAALGWIAISMTDKVFWARFDLDWRAVLFVAVLLMVATSVAGIAPALRVTRGSMFDALREATTALRLGRVSRWLIVAETTIAIAMLAGTFVMADSLRGFSDGQFPFVNRDVLVSQMYFGMPPALRGAHPPADSGERQQHWRAYLVEIQAAQRLIRERLASEPGARSVGYASHFPGNEPEGATIHLRRDRIDLISRSHIVLADASYLDIVGAPATSGRFFTDDDVTGRRAVAVVNEPFVRKHFGGGNPIGELIRVDDHPPAPGASEADSWRQIVGVIPDLGINPGNRAEADAVYVPLAADTVVRIGVASAGRALALVPALHRIALGVDPKPAVQWTTTIEAQMQEPVTAISAIAVILSALAAVALLLSCLGTYAIVAFSVAQRRREIAIRMAMGAGARAIAATVVGPSAINLIIGTVLGIAAGAGLQQLARQIPFALADANAGGYVVIASVIAVAGIAACAGPLRTALRLHPREWLGE